MDTQCNTNDIHMNKPFTSLKIHETRPEKPDLSTCKIKPKFKALKVIP